MGGMMGLCAIEPWALWPSVMLLNKVVTVTCPKSVVPWRQCPLSCSCTDLCNGCHRRFIFFYCLKTTRNETMAHLARPSASFNLTDTYTHTHELLLNIWVPKAIHTNGDTFPAAPVRQSGIWDWIACKVNWLSIGMDCRQMIVKRLSIDGRGGQRIIF